jgi:hypothetical protein
MKWVQLYTFGIFLVHVVYILVFVGIVATVPEQIQTLQQILQTVLCGVLLYRFRPPFNTQYIIVKEDASLIFGSAMLLFTNVVLVSLTKTKHIGKYIVYLQSQTQHYLKTMVNSTKKKDLPVEPQI